MTTVDVCVCTFQRASLAETLASLAGQKAGSDMALRVIVADNDERPSACELVTQTAAETNLDISYVHAPARNISIARNAALDASQAEWVAFIDDDETAETGWLAELLAEAARTGADIVLGPVVASYDGAAPLWMRQGDFHSHAPVKVRGEIRTGYTSNVLLRRAAPGLSGQRFRLDLGRSGGEDTEFFYRAWRAGVRIAYAAEAIVREPVGADRISMRWLLRRHLRYGQTYAGLILADRSSMLARGKEIVTATCKAIVCAVAGSATSYSPRRRAHWLLRGALHVGVVLRLCGVRPVAHYG